MRTRSDDELEFLFSASNEVVIIVGLDMAMSGHLVLSEPLSRFKVDG